MAKFDFHPPVSICAICDLVSVNSDRCLHCNLEAQEVGGQLTGAAQKQIDDQWPTEIEVSDD